MSFSPQGASQLTFYLRRLQKEDFTRKLSAVAGIAAFGLWLASTTFASPTPSNAASGNDLILGGFTSKDQLVQILQSNGSLKAVFDYFGIGAAQIRAAGGPTYIPAKNSSLISLGRIQHAATDTRLTIAGVTYFARPLSSVAITTNAHVITGTTSRGTYFAVLLSCGNIAVPSLPTPYATPYATPYPTPTRAIPSPYPTPYSTPYVTPTPYATPPYATPPYPTPPYATPPSPNLIQIKTAVVRDANGVELSTANKDHDTTTASPGNTITYNLITTNNGTGAQKNFSLTEDIHDILEYADVIDPGGATQASQQLTWAKTDIGAGQSLTKTFRVKVKDPLPNLAQGQSDAFSGDLQLDNVYGNAIHIKLPPPPPKQIEVAAAALPQTGPVGTTLTILFFAAVVYFYLRNRQLVQEVQILRLDNDGGLA